MVVHKTLNPQWNQSLEFADTGKPLVFHVKDHNARLRTSSIGDCAVEYDRLPPNQTADKWIPLQGVKSGEMHVKVTRKMPELPKNMSLDTDISPLRKANKISGQARELLKKLHGLIEDGDYEKLSLAFSEVENIEDRQVEYMLRLEKQKTLLMDKISEFGHEMSRTSSARRKISCMLRFIFAAN